MEKEIVNLLKETIDVLHRHNKKLSDITQMCDSEKRVYRDVNEEDLKEFLDMNYNYGHGLVEINPFLTLIGKDFWLERAEYDGREWWEYKALPNFANYSYLLRKNIIKDLAETDFEEKEHKKLFIRLRERNKW